MKTYPIKIGHLFKLSFGEELANAISHGVMAIACLILLPILSVNGYLRFGITAAIGFSIYLIALFLMFLMSTLYHSMKFETMQKVIFRILDHTMIYVAIAGSFTPVCLALNNPLSYIVLVMQWLMAIVGILYKSLSKKKIVKASLTIYLVMGWSALLLIYPIIQSQPWPFLLFIVLGGIGYSIGAYFYAQKDKAWFHFIWHLWINFASLCHMIAIFIFLSF